MTIPSGNNHIKVQALVNMLEVHDWYFDHSDYSMVWFKGNKQEKIMLDLVTELGDYGVEVFNQHAPNAFKIKRGR